MQEELVYNTVPGDTWDLISFKAYGTERYSRTLARTNSNYIKYVIFPAGIKINIPPLEKAEKRGENPPWL